MHELGHTAGLGHSSTSDGSRTTVNDVMNGKPIEIEPRSLSTSADECGLSDNDREAVKSIYQ